MSLTAPATSLHVKGALLLAAAMAAVVGGALYSEHVLGYIPCALCLQQRPAYYIGAPLLLVAGFLAASRLPGLVPRLLLLAGAGLMVWTGALGVYHSGVEWGWWAGPAGCSGAAEMISRNSSDLLASLGSRPPSCDQAAVRVLGLSFAGWNVIAAAFIAAACLWLAFTGTRRSKPRHEVAA